MNWRTDPCNLNVFHQVYQGLTKYFTVVLSLAAATQWLLEGTRRNETSLYITLTEPLDAIKANMTAFDWSLDGLKTLDLSSGRDLKEEDMGEYHIFPPSEVEQIPVWQNIYRAVQEIRPSRLVIDSAT
ncbi:MAG: hypothetical protein JRH08_13670 [Deltaproteobacteria bacterium]|nr:hypothetical protein [Deltaproteobacteria bacterium]